MVTRSYVTFDEPVYDSLSLIEAKYNQNKDTYDAHPSLVQVSHVFVPRQVCEAILPSYFYQAQRRVRFIIVDHDVGTR